jgi:hypothetical protein
LIDKILQLRILVGYLGEKDQFNWWDTAFLNATGQKFLKINFPRSAFSAGVHSVTEAAKQLHDKHIGRGRVFHLFRLPTMTEEKAHMELLNADVAPFPAIIETKENALSLLKRLAVSTLDAPEGPVQVGTLSKLLSDFAVEEMAKHYYDAFESGKQTFPYFTMD